MMSNVESQLDDDPTNTIGQSEIQAKGSNFNGLNFESSNFAGSKNPTSIISIAFWIGFNIILLALYLAFFHLSLHIPWPWLIPVGWAIAAVAAAVCFRFRNLFVNRYEFLFYLAIPLDIALESLVSVHNGYGFYLCAGSFWLVFAFYRVFKMTR